MGGFYRSIEYLAKKMNSTKDTKQSIITAASSYEHIQRKLKELEEEKQTKREEAPEKIQFNPNEIERIVLKSNNREER